MSRRWTEQEAPPPVDLRLVPAALAVWLGCLVGLKAAVAAWWLCAAALAVLAVLAACGVRRLIGRLGRRRHPPPQARASTPAGGSNTGRARLTGGAVAFLVCLASAAALGALTVRAAAEDPLAQAAQRHEWVVADLVVTADPAPVDSSFPISDGDDGTAGAGAPQRWRIAAKAYRAEIRGAAATSAAAVTLFGTAGRWADLVPGQTLRVRGVAAPDGFAVAAGVTLRAVGDPQVTGGPPWWSGWAITTRASLARSAQALDTDRAGLLRGLVVGDTAGIGPRLRADSKATGLTHLVAVSGSHVAMVCGVVLLLLRRTGPRLAAAGAAVTLAALVVLVGPQPSVLRAVVMGVVGMTAAVLGRARAALPGLAAAVLALLLADPELAVSAGFALSVQATAGLVLIAPAWTGALQRRGVPRGWAQLLVLPVAAQVTTMPVVAAISGTVSLAAVPANILVAPVVAPCLLIGLAGAGVGSWWPAAGEMLARVDGPLLGWITGVAHRLARWPSATVPWPAGPAGVLTLAALLTAGLLALRHRPLRAAVAAIGAGAVVVLLPAQFVTVGWPVTGWLLTACEVGQGDGMVLSTGTPGSAVVVDTGPDPGLMDACLDRLRVTTIPLLVITHLHADHVGGLTGAIGGRSVGAIGVGPGREPAQAWHGLQDAAADRGIPVVSLPPGTRWGSGDLALEVLGPADSYHGTDSDPNNDSVVMMATDRGVRILMTGDIEQPAQQALLDSGVDLRADVLKQPHHGSAKLLASFMAAVSPQVAVIGVGAGNDYGHPAAGALRADAVAGVATVLRTDTDGDVEVALVERGLATAIRGSTLPPGS